LQDHGNIFGTTIYENDNQQKIWTNKKSRLLFLSKKGAFYIEQEPFLNKKAPYPQWGLGLKKFDKPFIQSRLGPSYKKSFLYVFQPYFAIMHFCYSKAHALSFELDESTTGFYRKKSDNLYYLFDV